MTASPDFSRVLEAVRAAAEALPTFTSDDVWDLLAVAPAERNVVGKAFSEARRRGLIEGTEQFVQSRRPESKGRRIQVWTRRNYQAALL